MYSTFLELGQDSFSKEVVQCPSQAAGKKLQVIMLDATFDSIIGSTSDSDNARNEANEVAIFLGDIHESNLLTYKFSQNN